MAAAKIYGNKVTKFAHARGRRGDACYATAVSPHRRVTFATWKEAKKAGYKPCTKCRPDKA